MSLAPIYTAENCRVAYQLLWSLTLFWKSPPGTDDWLPALKAVTEPDGVRILEHRFSPDDCSRFLVSTLPPVRPSLVPWSVKGRLQHLVRERLPNAFQRNYDLRSIGSTKRDKVEAYVASQLEQHPPDDERLRALFADLQITNLEVDLSQPRFTAHARNWCNLHIVLVHDWRNCETRPDVWVAVRDMIRRASAAKGHLLSRVGIVPDHVHFTLGFHPDEPPLDIALGYMNNIAYVQGMKPIFMHSCYLGTIGEYDLGAAAGHAIFGGLAASGWHTAAITMRLMVTSGMEIHGGLIGLGVDELRWPRAVRPGDTLQVQIELLELKPSRSRPDRGTMKIRSVTTNQAGEVVLTMVSTALVPRREDQK